MTVVAADTDSTVVRLDESALNEAKSILYKAYLHEPTFHYLLEFSKPGYEKRVRATVRELISLYFDLEQDAIGLLMGDTLVAVAFVGSPELRLNLADQLSWRVRMMLTAGLTSTRRYIEYHRKIKSMLPEGQVHELPLLGVDPRYQDRGFGRLLLESVERLCRENPRTAGIVLDTGNSRYLDFYQSMGYEILGTLDLGTLHEHVLFKPLLGGGSKSRHGKE